MKKPILATLAALALSFIVPETVLAGGEDVVVERPWARASIGTSRPGVAYLTLRNTGNKAVTVTGIATPIAMMAEIHRTATNNKGVSSMAPAGDIAIAPGESVALAPGGLHAMLMKLQSQMTKGETFPLTLTFSDGGEVTVDVPILGLAARGPEG
jgi:copper(I)-binding protein